MNPEILGKIYELFNTMMPILCVMAVFYVAMVMPQRKKAIQQQAFLNDLKKGDKIVMSSGILGVVDHITDQEIRLTIANGVTISIEKSHVARLQGAESNHAKSPHPASSEKSSIKQTRKDQA